MDGKTGLSEREVSEIKSRGIGSMRTFAGSSTPLGMRFALFRRGECLVQPRLATIGGIAMNDPVLGGLVDSRNGGANLIGGAFGR